MSTHDKRNLGENIRKETSRQDAEGKGLRTTVLEPHFAMNVVNRLALVALLCLFLAPLRFGASQIKVESLPGRPRGLSSRRRTFAARGTPSPILVGTEVERSDPWPRLLTERLGRFGDRRQGETGAATGVDAGVDGP